MSIALRSALTSATNSVTERLARVGELAEEGFAGLFGLFDDLGDVAGVVAELAVGAGVEAALDPEHDQDQDDQAAAEGEAAPQHDLLAFGSALWALRAAARVLANPPRTALQAGWVAESMKPGGGAQSQQTVSFPSRSAGERTRGEIEGALVGSLVLNRFLIERRIGSGGFGVVYEAWDGRLERPVAVKAIEQRGEAGRRVLREAQAAARLNHPGIVTLYEMGEEDGNALLVTELVEGSTLARLAARRRALATARSARSAPTSARRSTTPTRAASSTATSSRRTCR